jgi:hypothetical protein
VIDEFLPARPASTLLELNHKLFDDVLIVFRAASTDDDEFDRDKEL